MRLATSIALALLVTGSSAKGQDIPATAPVPCEVTMPNVVLADGALSMKFGWERRVRGSLVIEGRRLDAAAPPLRASIPCCYGDVGFQATALIFPAPGCWEVTGHVGDEKLTFVTRVVKAG